MPITARANARRLPTPDCPRPPLSPPLSRCACLAAALCCAASPSFAAAMQGASTPALAAGLLAAAPQAAGPALCVLLAALLLWALLACRGAQQAASQAADQLTALCGLVAKLDRKAQEAEAQSASLAEHAAARLETAISQAETAAQLQAGQARAHARTLEDHGAAAADLVARLDEAIQALPRRLHEAVAALAPMVLRPAEDAARDLAAAHEMLRANAVTVQKLAASLADTGLPAQAGEAVQALRDALDDQVAQLAGRAGGALDAALASALETSRAQGASTAAPAEALAMALGHAATLLEGLAHLPQEAREAASRLEERAMAVVTEHLTAGAQALAPVLARGDAMLAALQAETARQEAARQAAAGARSAAADDLARQAATLFTRLEAAIAAAERLPEATAALAPLLAQGEALVAGLATQHAPAERAPERAPDAAALCREAAALVGRIETALAGAVAAPGAVTALAQQAEAHLASLATTAQQALESAAAPLAAQATALQTGIAAQQQEIASAADALNAAFTRGETMLAGMAQTGRRAESSHAAQVDALAATAAAMAAQAATLAGMLEEAVASILAHGETLAPVTARGETVLTALCNAAAALAAEGAETSAHMRAAGDALHREAELLIGACETAREARLTLPEPLLNLPAQVGAALTTLSGTQAAFHDRLEQNGQAVLAETLGALTLAAARAEAAYAALPPAADLAAATITGALAEATRLADQLGETAQQERLALAASTRDALADMPNCLRAALPAELLSLPATITSALAHLTAIQAEFLAQQGNDQHDAGAQAGALSLLTARIDSLAASLSTTPDISAQLEAILAKLDERPAGLKQAETLATLARDLLAALARRDAQAQAVERAASGVAESASRALARGATHLEAAERLAAAAEAALPLRGLDGIPRLAASCAVMATDMAMLARGGAPNDLPRSAPPLVAALQHGADDLRAAATALAVACDNAACAA